MQTNHFRKIIDNAGWTHTLPDHHYGLFNRFSSNDYIARIMRNSDWAQTDIEMPEINNFVTVNSLVSAGGTLGNWAGNDPVYIYSYYDMIGSINCVSNVSGQPNAATLMSNGVINIDAGIPFVGDAQTKTDFYNVAPNINGNQSIGEFTLFVIGSVDSTKLSTHVAGFGSPLVNGTSGAIQLRIAGDGTLRCYGASEPALLTPSIGRKIWSVFINDSDNRKMYINGQKYTDSSNGNPPVDDFYLNNPTLNSPDFRTTEAILYNAKNLINERVDIENTLNQTYNYYQ